MIFRIVILLSMLSPGITSAQLQVDSKQVSGLMSVTHGTVIPNSQINSSKAEDLKYSTTTSKTTKATTATTATKETPPPYTTSILYLTTNDIPAYKPKHYGVFCRIESKIEKKSKISPRFRLGSAEYVDMLEGKRGLRRSPSEDFEF